MRRLVALVALTFATVPSLAQVQAYGQSTCMTQSAGHSFRSSDAVQSFALQQVVASCQADSQTNNLQCSQNVICDGGSYQPTLCEATSGGLTFSRTDTLEAFAKLEAISDCQANSQTNNLQCSQNVVCVNPHAKKVACETQSGGLIFDGSDIGIDLSKQATIAQCQANSQTNNLQCAQNVVCDDGTQPIGECQTTSAGLIFREGNMILPFARQKALAECQGNSQTNNLECANNMQCAQLSPMPMPAPQPKPVPGQSPIGSGVCFVPERSQMIDGNRFFLMATDYARNQHQCVEAKIATVKQSTRLYQADGTRVAKDSVFGSKEAAQIEAAEGMGNCLKLTCVQQVQQ